VLKDRGENSIRKGGWSGVKVKLIVNPRAGNGLGLKRGTEVAREIEKRGIGISTSFTSRFREENATSLAKNAVQQGTDRIVVVGGDGTINEVANGIAGSGVPLGIIPAGVGNDFARALGIPEGAKKALNVAVGDKVIEVDLGRVNGRYFTSMVSFGFDACVNRRALELKRKYWFLPPEGMYVIALLGKLLSRLEYFPVEIDVPGTTSLLGKKLLIAVANVTRYGRILKIAPEANERDGLLDICLIREAGRLRIVTNIPRIIQGTHINLPEVEMLRVPSLTIRSSKNLPCQMDGEVLPGKQEYQISTFQGALKVLVP